MATTDSNIGSLKKATYLAGDSLLVAEQQGEAVAVEGSLFIAFAKESVKEHVDEAKEIAASVGGAVEEAKEAAADAVVSRDAAEKSRKAIEDMGVEGVELAPETAVFVRKQVMEDGTVHLMFGIPKGDPFTYDDFTAEQLELLKGAKGDPGEPFTIARTYASVDDMDDDFYNDEIAEGSFVVIASSTEDEDNAKLYIKGAKSYVFITDLSGAQGFKGDPGVGVASIEKVGGNSAPGTVDTYAITMTDRSVFRFDVYNGADGDGAGDMTRVVYDPQGKNEDIFAYADKDTMKALGGGTVSVTLEGTGWIAPVFANGRLMVFKSGSNVAAYSDDNGLTWTYATLPATLLSTLDPISAYGDGKFMIVTKVDNVPKAMYSTDGETWTMSNIMPDGTTTMYPPKALVYTNDKFLYVENKVTGSTEPLYYSVDGETWVAVSGSPYTIAPTVVSSGVRTLFVVFYYSYYSDDLETWTKFEPTFIEDEDPSCMVYADDRFVCVTDQSKVWTSADGLTWTMITKLPVDTEWSWAAYGNGRYVLLNSSGNQLLWSDDLTTWNAVTLPVSATWSGIEFDGERFILTAKNKSEVYTSVNGEEWSNEVEAPAGIYVNGANSTRRIADLLAPYIPGTGGGSGGGQAEIKVSGILKGDGTGNVTAAEAGVDYAEPIKTTGILKGDGTGAVVAAEAGVDYAAAEHTQSAGTITAGTFAGIVKAGSSYQNSSTYLLRNIRLNSADVSPTTNGQIALRYG